MDRRENSILGSPFRSAKDPTERAQQNPASGSDHFLSALADRIATEVADRVAGKLQKSAPVQKALFTVGEAALYIGRSKSAVQNMIHDRVLPVVRNGRRVHLLKRDLDDWIEKHRV
jgi:excisionase family DNA binding protein